METKTEEAKKSRPSKVRTVEHVGSFIRIYIKRINQSLDVQNT